MISRKELIINMIEDNPNCPWGKGMINNQHAFPRIKGTYGPLGTVAGCGCGAVAMHNVRTKLGESVNFTDMIWEIEKNIPSSVWALGAFGTALGFIPKFLKKHGYKIKIYTLNNVPFDCDAYILCYLHRRGGHYVAAFIDEKTRKIRTYNPNNEFLSLRHAAKKLGSKGMVIFGIYK